MSTTKTRRRPTPKSKPCAVKAKAPEMDLSVEQIGPAEATALLENSSNFREARDSTINQYAAMMHKREWVENGETIKLNKKGELIDGQHRLRAIIKSGVTLPMVVVRNVSPDFEIDSGKSRTLAQHLARAGFSNSGQLASMVVSIRMLSTAQSGLGDSRTRRKPSHASGVRFAKQHRGLQDVAASFLKMRHLRAKIRRPLLCIAYLAKSIDTGEAARFLSQIEGLNVRKGSVIDSMANRFSSGVPTSQSKTISNVDAFAYAVKTWNIFVQGTSIRLTWNATREDFPLMTDADGNAHDFADLEMSMRGTGSFEGAEG